MKYKISALAIALVLGVFAFMPTNVSAQTNPLKNISVTDSTGNLTNGVLNITSFAVKKGKVVANGTLTGTLNGQQINQAVSLPVTTGQHSCDILNLQLGPLDLNLARFESSAQSSQSGHHGSSGFGQSARQFIMRSSQTARRQRQCDRQTGQIVK